MVTNSYRPIIGGVEASIVSFRRGLECAGHTVGVIAPERRDCVDEEPLTFRVPAIPIPGKTFDGSLPLPARTTLEVITRGFTPEVIHAHHPFGLGNTAVDLARRVDVPVVYTFHTRYADYAQEHFRLVGELVEGVVGDLVQRFLTRCDLIIAPSESIRRILGDDVPAVVVPTPIDLGAFTGPDPEPIRRRWRLESLEIVGYMGRLVVEKQLPRALEAFRQVAEVRDRARLVLVGSGADEGRLRRLAAGLRIQDRVLFPGRVPHSEVPHVMTAFDLMCMPSATETQGLAAVEAMAAGTPVVAVEGPGSSDVLAEGGGVLVSPTSEALAEAMLQLLEDAPGRAALGAEAHRAARRFDTPRAVDALIGAYRQVVTTRAAP